MKNQLKEKIKKNLNSFSKQKYFNKYLSEEEKKIIYNCIGKSLNQKIYHFLNDLDTIPKCTCGKDLQFFSYKEGYRKFCSRSCRAKNLKHTPEQIAQMLESYKQTMIAKYGIENSFQLPSIKDKIFSKRDEEFYKKRTKKTKKVCLEKYGTEWPTQYQAIKDKTKQTNLKRYGRVFSGTQIQNRSKGEIEIYEYLKKTGFDVIHNTRNIIKPLELDIFLPQVNVAIEFNGIYFHCLRNIDHKVKMDLCKEKNIKLIQIIDLDFNKYKKEIFKNIENVIFNKPYTENFYIFYEKNNYKYQDAFWPLDVSKKAICITSQEKLFFAGHSCLNCGSYLLE